MSEDEDLALAIRELLIPQAFLLVISQVALNRLIDTWAQVDGIPPQEDSDDLALSLIEHGCKYILVTDIAVANNNIQHVLFDESGNKTVFELERELTPININTQISAALAATLALQVEFSEAAEQALQFTIASAQQTIRIGMGNPAPNNYFWTQRDSRNTETSPTTALSPSE
jgi:hydroxymethylpyrimidine/phosphomethylpyrimidine kinase